jgi:hypothetical protein
LPAFYYMLSADVRNAIELPLEEFVKEKERFINEKEGFMQQLVNEKERSINEKERFMQQLVNEKERSINEKERSINEKERFMQQLVNEKEHSIESIKRVIDEKEKYMLQLLDSKEQLLQIAAYREAELIRQIVNVHAVFSPRVVVSSIVQACAVGQTRLSVGAVDVRAFVNKFVYEKDQGLDEANHNKRKFSAAAAAFVQEIGTSDVRGIHQALDKLFQSLSRPHHALIPDIANFKGVVIGGPHCSEAEKEAYGMVIALGQQDVHRRTGTKPTDSVQDPVGLYDTAMLVDNSSEFYLKRQITGGHVVLIHQ